MSQTATSPRYQHPSPRSSSRPAATSSSRQPSNAAITTSAKMPALTSPRLPTPQQVTHTSQTPSPNYFGFQNGSSTTFLTESPAQHAKTNWSPPSSAVRSTAAVSPTVIPVDQRPEYAAFRKQSEGKIFNLGDMGDFSLKPQLASKKNDDKNKTQISPGRDGAKRSDSPSKMPPPPPPSMSRGKDSAFTGLLEVTQSPKRMLSPGSLTYPEHTRRPSPANSEPSHHSDRSSPDRHPRVPLPLDQQQYTGSAVPKLRAETLPPTDSSDSQYMVTSQHIVNLLESCGEMLLLLDLRVSTQYAASHITRALNMCIPTTLLKRPSFNVHKLADTFKDDEQRAKFERWRTSKYIIVYDNNSSQLKDASICMNTVKKFRSEGYNGLLYIIKGGFADFSARFPNFVDSKAGPASATVPGKLSDLDGPEVAPVAGGCPMPGTDNPANPFFGNIRQNMDLIGGVGQIALKHPPRATKDIEVHEYPTWLKRASEEQDQGVRVSKRFELIERREKKRMEDALSGKVFYGTPKSERSAVEVRVAGLEKGSKNRYNNIWPFEHSIVRLQGVPAHGCDYFNANFIKAAWSNKRYISTQAPIPATFTDFWNVVWQQDVRVIVMLTAEKEGAQVKAHNYWDCKQYGSLHLDFLSEKRASLDTDKIMRRKHRPGMSKRNSSIMQLESIPPDGKAGEQPYVIVRKFTLSHDNYPFERMREITQLQYSSWPDFGAPADPAHLIGLVEQCDAVVRSMNRSHSGEIVPANIRPVLVHCSAGCGRTGTFCTVDTVIDMLKQQRISKHQRRATSPMDVDRSPQGKRFSMASSQKIGFFDSHATPSDNTSEGSWVERDDLDLVEKTVEDFRRQRLSMVQSLRQYVLCYESIMEWIVEQELDTGSG